MLCEAGSVLTEILSRKHYVHVFSIFRGFCSENKWLLSCAALTAIIEFNITVTLKGTVSLLPNSFSNKELEAETSHTIKFIPWRTMFRLMSLVAICKERRQSHVSTGFKAAVDSSCHTTESHRWQCRAALFSSVQCSSLEWRGSAWYGRRKGTPKTFWMGWLSPLRKRYSF